MKIYLFAFKPSLLLLLIALSTSCMPTLNLPNPEEKPPVEEVDPPAPPAEIDWSTNTKVQLVININDETDGKYYHTVELFNGNVAIDTKAKMIAATGQKVNKNAPYNREVVFPSALKTVYIRVTDPYGHKRVYAHEVKEGTMVCNIGVNNTKTRSASPQAFAAAMSTDVDFTVPAGALKVPSNGELQPGNSYLIDSNTTFEKPITFPLYGEKVSLYIKGEWKIKNSFTLQGGRIFVLSGGTVTNKTGNNETISLNVDAQIAVQKGGSFGSEKKHNKDFRIDIKGSSTSRIINSGDFAARSISLEQGGGELYNLSEATMELETLTLNGGSVHNSCYILVTGATSAIGSNSTLNLSSGAYIKTQTFLGEGATVTMDVASQFIVNGAATFRSGTSKITGSNDDYALFQADKLESSDKNIWNSQVTITRKVAIKTNSTDDGCTVTSPAYYIHKGEKPDFEIEPTSCNGNNGYTPDEGTEPDDEPGYDEKETLPYTYLFEDNWPSKGDYDMNDLVMTVKIKNSYNANKVTGVTFNCTLHAVGGSKQLAAAFQLDNVPAANGGSLAENGYTNAVYYLFEDAHLQLSDKREYVPINTYRVTNPPSLITKEVTFSTPIDKPINIYNMNLFIVWGGIGKEKQNEIHLPNFNGTNLAAKNSASTNDYKNGDGWMWALCIPTNDAVTYPKESVDISDAYNDFGDWVLGGDVPTWYENYNEELIMRISE